MCGSSIAFPTSTGVGYQGYLLKPRCRFNGIYTESPQVCLNI